MNFIKRNKMKNGQLPWTYTIGDKDLKRLTGYSSKELHAYLTVAKRLAREGVLIGWERTKQDNVAVFYNPEEELKVYAWYKA